MAIIDFSSFSDEQKEQFEDIWQEHGFYTLDAQAEVSMPYCCPWFLGAQVEVENPSSMQEIVNAYYKANICSIFDEALAYFIDNVDVWLEGYVWHYTNALQKLLSQIEAYGLPCGVSFDELQEISDIAVNFSFDFDIEFEEHCKADTAILNVKLYLVDDKDNEIEIAKAILKARNVLVDEGRIIFFADDVYHLDHEVFVNHPLSKRLVENIITSQSFAKMIAYNAFEKELKTIHI